MTKLNKVCVIDDDEIFVFAFKKILKISRFCEEVTVFYNGEEALDGLQNTNEVQALDLIFLDINMPIMDGWGFLENFEKRKIDKNIPIYMLTSSIDKFDQVRAQNYELVSKYLVKPLTVEDLATLEV
ncbi:MAG: response regulator [Cytophagaceae bacterium]|nr:response regulator [Cytophagaceae bacterium]|tara:strand:- start:6355 stop:6735 length:381 start_codon:yes stop_codon:yes gene_type:complete